MGTTKVLITGAAGRIGRFLVPYLGDRFDLTLTDLRRPENSFGHPFIQADICHLDAIRGACQGINTVLHLAADPRLSAPWGSLLPNNLIGVYNVFEAAHEANCRRVILASSITAVDGYPREQQIRTDMPVRPGTLYGVSKAWGEAIACFYADQKGLSSICLRFGWVVSRDDENLRPDQPFLDIALTYEDLGRLVVAGIEAPDDLRFGIFHGVSNNRWKRLDITDTRATLGYAPEDDAFALADLPSGNPALTEGSTSRGPV